MADYRLTTSTPELGAAPLPSTAVGEYINQQTASQIAAGSDEAKRNAFSPTQQFTRDTAEPVAVSQMQKPIDTMGAAVKATQESNQRLASYAAQAAKVRQQQQAASSGGSYGYNGSNTYTVPAGVTGNRAAALREASTYLGNRYVLGGTSHQGIDCSGLVMMVYNKMGYNITQHSATWQKNNIPGVRTNDLNSLRPGDLVAWKDGSHIAIYAGNGEIIEAANEQRGTLRRPLWASPSAVVGIKLQFPGE